MILTPVLENLRGESAEVIATINKIVDEHTRKLDILVRDISTTLDRVKSGDLEEYPMQKLELDFALLTTEIYNVNSVLAELGGTSDMAKSLREISFSKAYLENNGNTVKEKESLANISTEVEQVVEKVYKRVLSQLRLKTENADNIHMALKRIHSARLTELEVFRAENLKQGGGKSGY